ncbi:MAG: hypothetical protein ACOVOR_02090 [Rhabdochlamydiaceae bacterium]
MTNIMQNFYEQNRITFFTLKDYSSITAHTFPAITYAATIICLSCIFSSSLKSPLKTSFLAHKAGLLLQESAKLEIFNCLLFILNSSVIAQFSKNSLDKEESMFFRVTKNTLMNRLITNLAIYSISFLLIDKTSTLKLSPSLMRSSFLILTHSVFIGVYVLTNWSLLSFVIKYMYIQSSNDVTKCLRLAIENRSLSAVKALINHEKFDYNQPSFYWDHRQYQTTFQNELSKAYKNGIFSEKEQKEINVALKKKIGQDYQSPDTVVEIYEVLGRDMHKDILQYR